MNIIMEKINSTIWNHHNTTVKDWERSLNINKQKKKFYRHHHNLSLDYPNLNMDDNRQRNNYVVRFNPNHSTPYNRSSGFSDNGAQMDVKEIYMIIAIAPYGNIYVNLGDFTESPDLEKLDIIKIGRLGD
ncbi:hypothetical protein RhiirC2_853650 [Rhizophagus irregularis]|uniref:Uncharacterized protein n=1 Tax=Rhizophagus irregularis TaxID=588596 RepID=A0A2N1MUP4_9GLOM|nr:hypothetical protein RhiirC2_853650 [Rhizophagus irregularis]